MSAVLATLARDAFAHGAQLAVVVVTGVVLSGLLRLRAPRVRLAFAQGLLVLAVALPWLQPWGTRPAARAGVTHTTTLHPSEGEVAFGVLPVLGAALVLGAFCALARLLRGLWRLRRYRLVARALPPLPVVDEASARAGVSAHMALSDDVAVPAAFGLRRPLVLLPARFLELAEDAQRAVLCHELVHVRRRDWLQMIAEETARALLWFHPAVWWLLARVRLAREQVVDEEVVHLTRERRVYLETLVGLAGVSGPSPAAAPLFLTESHLKSRIEALLEEVKMSKTHLWTRLVVSVAGVALAGAAAAWAFPLESAPSWFAAARTTGAVGAGEEVAPGAAAAEKKAAPRKPKVKVDAVYPTEAKTKGVEGSVVMDVWITAAGDVKEVKATKGPEELTRAAVDALRQWKFEPAAHETRATMTMRFVLDK